MFDPCPDRGQPHAGLLAAIRAEPAPARPGEPASDLVLVAVRTLSATVRAGGVLALDAAVRRIAALRSAEPGETGEVGRAEDAATRPCGRGRILPSVLLPTSMFDPVPVSSDCAAIPGPDAATTRVA